MLSLKFSNPKKSQVVIFDNNGSRDIQKMILDGIEHTILHTRYEVIYVSPQILLGALKNIKYFNRLAQGEESRGLKRFLKQCIGRLYRVYLLSCIEYIKPRVVVTVCDNSYSFQVLSRIYKEAKFIAIQNGMRIKDCLKDSLPPSPNPGSIISMPMLVCFSNHDVDLYKYYDHQIDEYYPLGSLRARYYRNLLFKERLKPEFDLCLISIWDENLLSGEYMPKLGKGMEILNDFINRYLKERNVSLCVAMRHNSPLEEKYYLNLFGSKASIIKANKEVLSSYDAIDRSSVAISVSSTLAREAFGWGAKILSCNFSGDEQWDFPISGFWSLNEPNYDLFKQRLDHLLEMNLQEYYRQTKDSAAYIMNNEARPPHEFVRELILKQIDSNYNDRKDVLYGTRDICR